MIPVKLWLYNGVTDMRKSYDGLSAIIRNELGGNPLNGHGYIFINRSGNQLKCLYFERGGYCIWSKRLEQGRFAKPHKHNSKLGKQSSWHLSQTEFYALVEGFEVEIKKRKKRWLLNT